MNAESLLQEAVLAGAPIARAYIRVSRVGKREETLLSPELQLAEARKLAEHRGFTLDEAASHACADLDVSGFKGAWRKRPGMQRLYADAERGLFRHLIFYKLSRLGRNVRESLDLIDAFERLGVSFHFVKDDLNTSTPNGRLMRNVLLSLAEAEAENTRQFVRDAVLTKARSGRPVGNYLPVWIRREGGGAYAVVEEQAEAIRRLVALRLEGYSYVRIARALNTEGFLTVNGRAWTDGMTYKYLRPDWIDTMRGTAFVGRDRPAGDPERVVIPGAYPAILSEEEAAALCLVQQRYTRARGHR